MVNLHVAYQANPSNGFTRFADACIERWPHPPRTIADVYALKDHLLAQPHNTADAVRVVIILSITQLGDEYSE
jgi:hypothetical protein